MAERCVRRERGEATSSEWTRCISSCLVSVCISTQPPFRILRLTIVVQPRMRNARRMYSDQTTKRYRHLDIRDSKPDWGPYEQPKTLEGTPNVLYIVWDDFRTFERLGDTADGFGNTRRTDARRNRTQEGISADVPTASPARLDLIPSCVYYTPVWACTRPSLMAARRAAWSRSAWSA
jgi:hypothetical protein